jgi:hypothetical protein
MQPRGRTVEVQFLGDGDELSELAEIDHGAVPLKEGQP